MSTDTPKTFGWTFDKPCEHMDWTPFPSIELKCGDGEANADLTIVCLGEADVKALSSSDDKVLCALLEDQGDKFKAKAGSCTDVGRVMEGDKLKKIVLVGLGSEEDIAKGAGGVGLKVGSAIAKVCQAEKQVKVCTVKISSVPDFVFSDLASSFYSDMYSDNRYRNGDKQVFPAKDLESVTIAFDGDVSAATKAIENGIGLAKGIYLCKDIVNAPHNVLNSVSLANTAVRVAKETGGVIETKILDKDECEKRKMGSYLGVARGSETPPKFIHMTYKPKTEIKRKIGIVGKGLLFDTGGYNIKVQMMELMKFDCGGAAAVIGAAMAIAALQPEGVEVHFCVAACENMVNERAYVPSDILIASNGKSIEVLNTDAEGRLTLADALVYADKEVGCEKIIELSTLTGTCMLALGKEIAGVFTKSEDLAKELETASKSSGNKTWRLPMPDEYNEQLKSKIADIQNIGTRFGGSITAALFLQNFVSEDKPFAHLDIAGPVWNDKTCATGYGTSLITDWVFQQGSE